MSYHDGACHQIANEEGSRHIKELIDRYHPDTIITFGSDGLTGHPDHQAVSRWAAAAARGTHIKVYHKVEEKESFEKYMEPMDKQFNIYFNINKPPIINANDCEIALTLSPELMRKKRAALKSMPSQTEAMFKQSPKGFLDSSLKMECFVLA